jgi:hypothetical protein
MQSFRMASANVHAHLHETLLQKTFSADITCKSNLTTWHSVLINRSPSDDMQTGTLLLQRKHFTEIHDMLIE